MRLRVISLGGLLVFLTAQPLLRAEGTNEPSDFKEIYDLIRAHAAGLSEADLNQAAVRGLVSALAPKVTLITNVASSSTPASPIIKSNLFDDEIAYLRVGRVADGLAQQVADACETWGASNKVKGIVLDLRYSRGNDYAAAAATADLFLKKERPLLNWGNGIVKSKEKKEAVSLPVAALVNRGFRVAREQNDTFAFLRK